MSNSQEELKIIDFKNAMHRYENNKLYILLERLNSTVIITLQFITLFQFLLEFHSANSVMLLIAFCFAYLATDFINGLIHMFMDNNTHYHSCIGPLVSSFHVHHATIQYKNSHPLSVYFFGSGTKFWLSFYLMAVVIVQHYLKINEIFHFFLVSVGILSSFAEISHYWCHNSTSKNRIISLLQKYGILLSKKHHSMHHRFDNRQYAFLNGATDPLLNLIAKYACVGYKNHADKHMQAYKSKI
jgi:hypothetical protein